MCEESKIEKAKIDLALRSDFNVEDAYRIFELDGRGFVTEADLKYGLNNLDIFPSNNDIKLLMRRTDIKRCGTINYQDFFDLVTPFEKNYRNMVENRLPSNYTPNYNKADVFLFSTKLYLKNLFNLIIQSENKLENMRCTLSDARCQVCSIFKCIDKCCCGYFNDCDLINFLKSRCVFASDTDIGLAFIRLDRNRNGRIELWEVIDELNMTC